MDLTQRDPWYKVWLTIYFHPSVQAYKGLLSAQDVRISRAYKWVAINTGVSSIFPIIIYFATNRDIVSNDLGRILQFGELAWVLYFISVVFAVIVAPLLFFVVAKIINWLAQKQGGSGVFEHLGFLFGAAYAPMILFDNLFETIFSPLLGFIFRSVLLGLIAFYTVVSIKTVHQLSWLRSLVPIIILGLFFFIVFVCLLAIMLS